MWCLLTLKINECSAWKVIYLLVLNYLSRRHGSRRWKGNARWVLSKDVHKYTHISLYSNTSRYFILLLSISFFCYSVLASELKSIEPFGCKCRRTDWNVCHHSEKVTVLFVITHIHMYIEYIYRNIEIKISEHKRKKMY